MANRYWVGGTASWDGTAGTKWALTSGGAGGQAVPTSADDVFFSALSTGTVTIATGNTGAKSIDCTGFTGTLTGTAAITVAGSITLVAGMTYTHTGNIGISGTGTLTTAGKAFSGVVVNGAGITVTLGDALNTSTRNVTVTTGTFTTSASNYSVTAGAISSNGTSTRTISLNASTVTLGSTAPISINSLTGLTFNAGTSQINHTANGEIQAPTAGLTFYNWTNTSTNADEITFNGTNTFNNLTCNAPTSGIKTFIFAGNQTVNGTLTVAGTTQVIRIAVRSSVPGTARTLTVATLSAANCDFTDITLAGAASPASPSGAGDCGGNTNITFPSPKTVYWNLAGTTNINSNGWAATSGGVPNIANYPLPQDTAIFDDAGSAGTVRTVRYFNYGTIDTTVRTSAMTFDFSNGECNIIGSIDFSGSGVTVGGTNASRLYFRGNSAQTLISSGKTMPPSVIVQKGGGALVLGDALTTLGIAGVGNAGLILDYGTFNANNYNVTCTIFQSTSSNTRTLTMGSGTWTLTNTTATIIWNLTTITGLTYTANTAPIVVSGASAANATTFAGGGLTYNNLSFTNTAATGTITFTGANTFGTLSSSRTGAYSIVFPNVTTTVSGWSISGSLGNLVTLARTGASGTFTLAKSGGGVVSADYLSISNSTATPSSTWYAGANSTNGGGNTGWIFTAAPTASSSNFFLMF